MSEIASHGDDAMTVDDSVATPEEVAAQRQVGDAEADQIPGQRADYRFSRKIVVLSDPSGIQAESIGALRAHMLAQHLRDGRRSLAICGASANIGVSFVAVNLAVSLAVAGIKTLLIDANMRGSGIEDYIQPAEPKEGLVQYLADPSPLLGDYVQDEVISNLALIYSGGVIENPQERLARGEFKTLVDACMRDFDVTIIDCPPANESADARRIATVARYAMVVSRRHESFVADVRTLVEELHGDRAKVVGTFLNDF